MFFLSLSAAMSFFFSLPLTIIINCALTVVLVKINDYLFEDQRITRGMYLSSQNIEVFFGMTAVVQMLAKETWSEYDVEMFQIILTTWAFKVVYSYWKFGRIGLWMDEEWKQLMRDKVYDYFN